MLLFATIVALLATGSARVNEDVIITPSDGASFDGFAYAMDASGNLLVAGSRFDDDDGTSSGSAYVFLTADGGSSWSQVAKLAAPDAAANDYYGESVAVDGNYIVVGASGNDDVGSSSGSAYVYRTTDGGSTWSAAVKITPSDLDVSDSFGETVAVNGDIIAVSSVDDDDGGTTNGGSVYIFGTSDGGATWTQTDKISSSDLESFDQFGAGGIDIDGSIMVIGVYRNDDAGSDTGSAYAFRSTDGGLTWTEAAKLTADDAAASDFFGQAVAVSGDFIAVGSPSDDDGGTGTGSVYVYTTSDGGANWEQSAKLVSDAPEAGAYFGTSTAADGNLLVVGARGADSAFGLVFVFETSDGGSAWTLVEKLSASDAENTFYYSVNVGTELGSTVAVAGDLVFGGAKNFKVKDQNGAVYAFQHGAGGDVGSVGDPILVDFAGHRFLGGSRANTEYLLYRSQDETEAITMTTSDAQGKEDGFFAAGVSVSRVGCGSLHVLALAGHKAEISGDACMTSRIARGDEGLVLIPIGPGGDAGSVLAVYPHGTSPAFVNLKLLATTPAFQAGCTGMLCNEAHADIEA